MSKKLQNKLAIATMSAVVASTAVTPLQAAETQVTNTQGSNVSVWAEAEVKDFLGNSFNPNYNYKFKVTRAEFAELLEKALMDIGYVFNEPSGNPFKDTKNKSVIKMYQAGLLAGTSDNLFSPNDSLTREQLAVIICRIYSGLEVPMPKKVVYSVKDHNKISSWARSSVKMAFEANIISGDKTGYNPKAIVPREQAIVILSRTQDIIKEYKDSKANADKGDANTQKPEKPVTNVINNDLYTYNKDSKEIIIKKDCILDVSKAGTPSEFSKVTVNAGVETEFKGIKISNLILEEDAKFTGTDCSIDNVTMRDSSTFECDKATSVKTIKTYDSATINTTAGKIDSIVIYEGDTDSEVEIEGEAIKEIKIEAPAVVDIDGEVGKVSIDTDDAEVTVSAEVDDITVNKDDVKLSLKTGAKVDSVTLDGESTLNVAKDTRLKKLSVEEDAIDSVIELKSKYDIDLSIKTKCKINGHKVDEEDEVEYKDGKLYINDSDKGSASESKDEKAVAKVLEKLTYERILGDNKDKDNVKYDLDLPTEMDGCSITWMSENEAVISTSGKVTRIDKGSEVVLRAKVKKGNVTENKSFNVYVLPKEQSASESIADKLKADLEKIQIPATISETYTLPTETENKYPLSYSVNHPNARISGNVLEVTRGEQDANVTLTLTATSGNTFQTATRTFVIPKKDTVAPPPEKPDQPQPPTETPEENKDQIVSDAFAKLNIPDTLDSEVSVPKVIDNVTFAIQSSGDGVTVTERDGNFVLTPNKTTEDQTITLSITGSYKDHTKQFSKIVKVNGEQQGEVEDPTQVIMRAWEKFSVAIPETLDRETTISAQVDGVTFAVSSEQSGVTTTNGENVVLTPHPTEEPQQVNLSITGSYKGESKSFTKYVTVPKVSSVPEEGKTEEDIRQDMRNILGSFQVGESVPFTVPSGIGMGDYSISLNPLNKHISVQSDGSKFVVTHNNTLLSEPVNSGVTVKLTLFSDGKAIEETRDVEIQVVPKYTEEEWKGKLDKALAGVVDELVALIPTSLNGTSQPIKMHHAMEIEGVDFYATIVPQLGPNVKEPTPADEKLEITYDATNHFTLNPKVLDGSSVPLKVKFAYQLGNTVRGVAKDVTIQLANSSEVPEKPATEEAFKTLNISAEIFEIINSIDLTFQNTVETPEFKLVVKDKHLEEVLGETPNLTLPKKGENNYGGKVEVTLSKNAILGEYVYEIHSNGKIVKTGDLVNNGSSLSFTEI